MKLTKGQGTRETGGCWMVAASMYNGEGWHDHPECVPPTIRHLCMTLNDMCSNGEREALIGPHLFTPMGRDNSKESEHARANLCADWAVRRYALGTSIDAWAQRWLSGEDRTEATAYAAYVNAAAYATAYAAATTAAAAAARAAAYARDAARDAAAATAACAACAAAADAAGDKQALLDLILECCAIGAAPPELDPKRVNEIVCKLEEAAK